MNKDEKEIERIMSGPNSVTRIGDASRPVKNIFDCVQESIDLGDVVICKDNCKMCNFSKRMEAEETWERTKSYTQVQNFTKANGLNVSIPSIKSHLINHYQSQETNLRIKEYASNYKKWHTFQIEKEDRLENYLKILDKQLVLTMILIDENNPESMQKANASISQLMSQAVMCMEKLDEYRSAADPAKIILTRFKNIIQEEVPNMKSIETKQAVYQILEKLVTAQSENKGS